MASIIRFHGYCLLRDKYVKRLQVCTKLTSSSKKVVRTLNLPGCSAAGQSQIRDEEHAAARQKEH